MSLLQQASSAFALGFDGLQMQHQVPHRRQVRYSSHPRNQTEVVSAILWSAMRRGGQRRPPMVRPSKFPFRRADYAESENMGCTDSQTCLGSSGHCTNATGSHNGLESPDRKQPLG
jgi:hypothetical protein